MTGDDPFGSLDRVLEGRDREQRQWQEDQRCEQREWLDALTERHAGIAQKMIEAIAELQAEIADQGAQIQANTQAVLRILDRLEPEHG